MTDAELDRITAGTLRIGRNDALESSLVIVSATIDPALTNTLHILSGHVISQNVGANVIVSNLALSTDSTVALSNPGNVVDTLAVSSGENVTFRNCQATGLTVGSVDGVDGVSATAFVNLRKSLGPLTVSNTAAANDISAGNTIDITVDADNAVLTIEAGANSESTGGAHAYTSDEIDIQAGATVTGTGQIVTLQPNAAGEQINIGSVGIGVDDVLELSDAELDRVTATTIRVGQSTSGAVTFSLTTSITTATNLHVRTGATVMQAAAVMAPNLAVSAGGAVDLTAMTNDVDVLAITTTTGNVDFIDSFSIGTVDGVEGVSTANGNVALTAVTGDIVVTNTAAADDVSATGTITLRVMGDDDTLTIEAGADSSSAGNITLEAGDAVTLIATRTVTAGGTVAIKGDCGNNDAFGSTITISDDAGTDTLNVSGSADAKTIFVRTTANSDTVSRGSENTETVIYDNTIEALNILGGSENDIFDVQPSQLVPIFIDGQPPVRGDAGVPPGDTLLFDPGTNTFEVLNKNMIITTNTNGGAPFENITFTSIETFGFSPLGVGTQRFDFDQPPTNSNTPAITAAGYTSVRPDTEFSDGLGFG